MKIARKLRDDLLARYTEMRQNPNGIKAFQTMSVTETGVFQDRLVMTASISLRIIMLHAFCTGDFIQPKYSITSASDCQHFFENASEMVHDLYEHNMIEKHHADGYMPVYH